MLPTQAVNHRMDQPYTTGLNENLLTLRQQLGHHADELINDERLNTMLRITKGDVDEARFMALGYVLHTLKLQAQNHEGDMVHNRHLTEHFTAMSAMTPIQRPVRSPNLKTKSRSGLFQFLVKRS